MLNKQGQRELCYVVEIDNIEPIQGSDNCEAAVVGGWRIMVRKNTFKIHEMAVYFEIDSKVPETKEFEFLAAKHYKIKTQKYTFGGKGNFISQGLLMSLSDFPQLFEYDEQQEAWFYTQMNGNKIVCLNDFLTKILKVKYSVKEDNIRKSNIDKYKKMAERHSKLFKNNPIIKWLYNRQWGKKLLFVFLGKKSDKRWGGWPVGKFEGVSKTDQERVENMTWVLNDKSLFVKTTKIDGTSGTYILEKKPFGRYEYYVCSRNVRMMDENQKNYHSDDENIYWQASNKYKIREFLQDYIEKNNLQWACIQGEVAGCSEGGVKIQGDPHHLESLRFFGFHLTDSKNGRIEVTKAKEIANSCNIEWVPVVDTEYILPDDFDEFKKSADGDCEAPGSSGMREGYVYYKKDEPTFSFKNVSNEYLASK